MKRSLVGDLMQARGFKNAYQVTLAAAAGVTQAQVSRVLSGKRRLTDSMAKRLARALGVTPAEVRALLEGRP